MAKTVELLDVFPIYGYENDTLISKEKGCLTVAIKLQLPEVYSLDENDYLKLNGLMDNVIATMGENVILHFQDYFLNEEYTVDEDRAAQGFLNKANENYFAGRSYNRLESFLYISKVPKGYLNYSSSKVNAVLNKTRAGFIDRIVPEEFIDSEKLKVFYDRVDSTINLINESQLVVATKLNYDELFKNNGLYEKYFTLERESAGLRDIDFSDNATYLGNKKLSFHTLENLDQFDREYIGKNEYLRKLSSDKTMFPVGPLYALGFKIPFEHIINRYVFIPENEKVLKALRKKAKKFNQFSSGKKDDENSIYSNQIYDFNREVIEANKSIVFYHLNVMGISNGGEDFNKMNNAIDSAFKGIKIKAKYNTIDRKNLFYAGIPGNAIGVSSDLYMPVSSTMAAALCYWEGEYKDATSGTHGVKLTEPITQRPINVSIYKEPENSNPSLITNRGTLIASGSGGGKSFIVNHVMCSDLRNGAEAVIMEDGNSYDRLVELFGGKILEHQDDAPFTFNPFSLDPLDVIVVNGVKKISDGKMVRLLAIINIVLGGEDISVSNEVRELRSTILDTVIYEFYTYAWDNKIIPKWDSFYDFCCKSLRQIIIDNNIPVEKFDVNTVLTLFKTYSYLGTKPDILNNTDPRLENLADCKVIYFKLHSIVDNKRLFPIVAMMLMEIYDKKVMDDSKLRINKMLVLDEAWKVLASPELEGYFNAQSRIARKRGGQPIFISQKVDDFVASDVIKEAIVVNSHIKIFLDMRDLAQRFDNIQNLMGLTDNQKVKILALNKDIPKGMKYKQACICWKEHVKIYNVETSKEEHCIYETSPNKSALINELLVKNNNDWQLTTAEYASIN